MKHYYAAYIGFFGLCFLTACGGSSSPKNGGFAFQNTIFTRTQKLIATANIPNPSQPGQPSFSWPASGQKHTICAIFSERIQVKANRITNTSRVVWLWHSGLGKGREGNLLYEHGSKGEKDPSTPGPLAAGTYFWAVWVINDTGSPILSTVENSFTVK